MRILFLACLSACSSVPLSAPEMALSSLAPARGNLVADSDDAARLGFRLFFNQELGGGVGCVTCHAPELAFTDGLPVSRGRALGVRNAPTVFNAARLNVFFWDGRADSLWSQPLFAIENPVEMGSSRLELAHFVDGNAELKSAYETVFGPMPSVSAWPATGKPGEPAFDGLSVDTQTAVNRVAANIGKAFEAYLRKNTSGPGALDAFLRGDDTLNAVAQRGLQVFLAQKCNSCHAGPMLTDEKFHVVGFPVSPNSAPDRGRAGGVPILAANPFNLAGPYADGPVTHPIEAGPADEGAFRTPSLRNVARTAPYGHDGALGTLRDVFSVHAPGVNSDDQTALVAFMQSLNGDYPAPPWNDWPSHQ